MNTPCAQANYPDNSGSTPANGSGGYAVRHDPFAYYSNLGQATAGSICTQHVLGWSSWYAAEASTDPAQYIFITPDTCHDGHNDCSSYDGRDSADEGDYWLSTFIPQIQNQSWYSSTVIFVAYDEGESTSTTGYNGTAGGQTYFAAISPYTQGVGNYAPDATHYDVLCTTEWLLGVGTTGNNECTPQFPAMKSLFNFSSAPPTSYPVSGTVEGINLLPVAGAGVSIDRTLGDRHRAHEPDGRVLDRSPERDLSGPGASGRLPGALGERERLGPDDLVAPIAVDDPYRDLLGRRDRHERHHGDSHTGRDDLRQRDHDEHYRDQ